jgi:hypothetical protein
MKNCLDCLNCKIKLSQRYVYCSAGLWNKDNYTPKIALLTTNEVNTLHIKSRQLFFKANNCQSMISMD